MSGPPKSPNFLIKILLTIIFFPCLSAGNFSTILLPILHAFKKYVEYLYRHLFFEDTCTNIRVTFKHVLRRLKNIAPYNFSTHQPIVNLFMDITANGFGKPHTNFGVLLSMYVWVMTVSNMGCWFFSDLEIGARIFYEDVPIETFNLSFESTQNMHNNMVLKLPAQR